MFQLKITTDNIPSNSIINELIINKTIIPKNIKCTNLYINKHCYHLPQINAFSLNSIDNEINLIYINQNINIISINTANKLLYITNQKTYIDNNTFINNNIKLWDILSSHKEHTFFPNFIFDYLLNYKTGYYGNNLYNYINIK